MPVVEQQATAQTHGQPSDSIGLRKVRRRFRWPIDLSVQMCSRCFLVRIAAFFPVYEETSLSLSHGNGTFWFPCFALFATFSTWVKLYAPTESFFGTLKRECTHRQSYQTQVQATQSIFDYIETFYNRKRRHSAQGYLSLFAFERRTRKEPELNV
jgi:hypothetical protein